MALTVTLKGQVTLPKAVRDRLGLRPGNAVDFKLTPDGQVLLVKADQDQTNSRFAALRGRAGLGPSTDEIMALTPSDR